MGSRYEESRGKDPRLSKQGAGSCGREALPRNFRLLLLGKGLEEEQGDDVCEILAANGFTVRQRVKDFCGTERAVIAQYCVEE